jgi:hypothetical protein
MTWDTEQSSDAQSHSQMTTDTYGYGDSYYDQRIIWSDDPERAYFDSMIQGEEDQSFIGDSSVVNPQKHDSVLTREEDTPRGYNHAIDSSGLSHYDTENEDDTVARIEANPDDSGWFFFRRQRGTAPVPLQIPPAQQNTQDPAPSPGMASNFKSPISALSHRDAAGDGIANMGYAVPNPNLVPTSPGNRPVAVGANQGISNVEGYGADGKIIPGYIFVTQGQSSAVLTKQTPDEKIANRLSRHSKTQQHPQKGADLAADDQNDRPQRKFYLCKLGLLFLLAALTVGIAMLSIMLRSKRDEASSSESTLQNPSPPTFAPTVLTPTSSRAPIAPPTVSSTSTAAMDQVKDFLISQFPDSASAIEDASSPQYMALEWITQDLQANRRMRGRRHLIDLTKEPRLVQRWILAVTYFATGGRTIGSTENSTWTLSDGWLGALDECQWEFVLCNDVGKVEELSIQENMLVGSIPPEIGWLGESLIKLALQTNQLVGNLPSTMGFLTGLKRLSLDRNLLSGSLPSEVGLMTSLSTFGASQNLFKGQVPTSIAALTSLTSLDLSSTNFSGTIPSELALLTALKFLSFGSTAIEGTIPTELGNLAKLEKFKVARTSVSGSMPEGICARVPEMTELKADCNEISCQCCTICCVDGIQCDDTTTPAAGGTVSPTMSPSLKLTDRPTTSPTVTTSAPAAAPVVSPVETIAPQTSRPPTCAEEISTDKDCYLDGDDIVVFFKTCDAKLDDWIGVYSSNQGDWQALDEPIAWLWTAGDQFMQLPVKSGSVTFPEARGTGSFQIVIAGQREVPPFQAYAVSAVFRLSADCGQVSPRNTLP